MKKLQASLIILIMVVSVAVMGWVYTMTSAGPAFQNRLVTEEMMQQTSYLMDSAKTASKVSGQAAMYMALHESSQNGGINSYGSRQMEDKRFWFCNGNNVPDAKYINYFLSMKTKEIVNSFLVNLNTAEVTITDVDCVDYGLEDADIDPTNRKFAADFFGSVITVTSPSDSTSPNDFTSEVNDVPYWEMYNGFSEWISDAENKFTADMCECIVYACDCNPQPGECTEQNCPEFYTCITEKLDALVNTSLESKFTDDVDCSYTMDHCYMEQGVADPNGDCGETCHSWEPTGLNYVTCYLPEENTIDCSQTTPIMAAGDINLETNVYSFADQCKGNCYDPQEERVSLVTTVTCVNNDYNIPVGGETVPFSFSTKLWFSRAVGGACSGGQIPCTFNAQGECTCGSAGKKCEDCRILGGSASAVLIACENYDCSGHRDECYDSNCKVDENGDPYCQTAMKHKCGCDPADSLRWCDVS